MSRAHRCLVAALAVVTAATAGVLGAAPAEAAGPKHPRVMPMTASSSYLVYRQKTASAVGLGLTRGSRLYWIGRSGGRHALTDFDPELFPSLEGSTLVQTAAPNAQSAPDHDPAAPEHVRWRDLRTGGHGVVEIPAGDDLVGAAPGGWIALRTASPSSGSTTTHVVRYSTDGTSVDLGAPLPGAFRTAPGPEGIVASTADPSVIGGRGTVRYLAYGRPGTWRTVSSSRAYGDVFCSRPSATHAVCEIRTGSSTRSGEVLLALDGTGRAWLSAHPRSCQTIALIAVGGSAVGEETTDQGPCVDGRLTRLSAGGGLTRSERLFGEHASNVLEGLGGTLVDSPDQRRIVRLTGVRSTPRTVARAR